MLTAKYKLKNNFEVSKLMKEIDIDFIYSETDDRFPDRTDLPELGTVYCKCKPG